MVTMTDKKALSVAKSLREYCAEAGKKTPPFGISQLHDELVFLLDKLAERLSKRLEK